MASKKTILVMNVLYWLVGALVYPLANLIPTSSGEMPKIFELFIPLMYVALAFASTTMFARALKTQKVE